MEKQKEYNLRYLLAKVRTTWGKASDRLRQRANKRNKNRVGRLLTSEQNWKIILSDEVRQYDQKPIKPWIIFSPLVYLKPTLRYTFHNQSKLLKIYLG
jgi:hypothetical protein